MDGYYVITSPGKGEVTDRKSRFIGHAMPIGSPEEAAVIIDQIKRKYWDARHNCYAYVTGGLGEISKCSDDGEPSGTAGKPILDVITGMELRNALVVVTRYFGGTLLGTGGLVRAYTRAAKAALDNAGLKAMVCAGRIRVTCDYGMYGALKNFSESEKITVSNENFAESVDVELTVEEERIEYVINRITDLTGAKAGVELLEKGFFPI